MCQSTLTPESGNPRLQVPGAWYDVSSRISAARAVASQIYNCIPCGDRAKPVMSNLDDIASLAGAVVDLLDLAQHDNNLVEEQILATARKGA